MLVLLLKDVKDFNSVFLLYTGTVHTYKENSINPLSANYEEHMNIFKWWFFHNYYFQKVVQLM